MRTWCSTIIKLVQFCEEKDNLLLIKKEITAVRVHRLDPKENIISSISLIYFIVKPMIRMIITTSFLGLGM